MGTKDQIEAEDAELARLSALFTAALFAMEQRFFADQGAAVMGRTRELAGLREAYVAELLGELAEHRLDVAAAAVEAAEDDDEDEDDEEEEDLDEDDEEAAVPARRMPSLYIAADCYAWPFVLDSAAIGAVFVATRRFIAEPEQLDDLLADPAATCAGLWSIVKAQAAEHGVADLDGFSAIFDHASAAKALREACEPEDVET